MVDRNRGFTMKDMKGLKGRAFSNQRLFLLYP